MVRRGRSICRVAAVAGFVVGTAVLPVAAAGAAQSKPARGPRVGTLLATVHDPVGSIGGDDNEYGGAIAISKTILVVGEDGANGSLGVTFIYVEGRSGWPKLPTVTLYDPAQTFYDLFGESVAISGNTLIVGAPGTDSGTGAAYVYVADARGWPTTPSVTLHGPTARGAFGFSVAISGATAVVGAPDSGRAGTAYVYARGTSRWPTKPAATLPDPTATAADGFGQAVAVSGNTIIAGASGTSSAPGSAYVYVNSGSGWSTTPVTTLPDPTATADDAFGSAVAVSGTTAAITAWAGSNGGATYIYSNSGSGWPTTPTTTLQDPAATGGDEFGDSVAVSVDAIVVGALGTKNAGYGAGAAYIYVKGASGWPTTPTVSLLGAPYMEPGTPAGGSFGFAAAASGTTAVISAQGYNPGHGAAYIYKT